MAQPPQRPALADRAPELAQIGDCLLAAAGAREHTVYRRFRDLAHFGQSLEDRRAGSHCVRMIEEPFQVHISVARETRPELFGTVCQPSTVDQWRQHFGG